MGILYQNKILQFFYVKSTLELYIYTLVSVSFIMMAIPQLDLAISRVFFSAGEFYLQDNPYLLGLRDVYRDLQPYLYLALLLIIGVHCFVRKPIAVLPPHKAVFVLLSFALGAGVIVSLLKIIVGRARPRNLIEFGGTLDFTPAWQFAENCSKNCSFPSGEGAAAATFMSILVFFPPQLRKLICLMILPVLLLISFNRVLFGAHFFSDVVIAWLLMIGVMMALWSYISNHAERIDGSIRNAGRGIRERLGIEDRSA